MSGLWDEVSFRSSHANVCYKAASEVAKKVVRGLAESAKGLSHHLYGGGHARNDHAVLRMGFGNRGWHI